jgi:uncharacterized membrane protein
VERTDLSRLLAFALIGRFWLVHHRMFEAVRAFDARLMTLNLGFLALTVLMPFATELYDRYADVSTTAAALLWLSTLALRSPLGWLGATAR